MMRAKIWNNAGTALVLFLLAPVASHAAETVAEPAQAQPAATQPAPATIDPALLAKAHVTAEVMIPDGTFEKMFGPMMDQLMSPLMDKMMDMPVRDLASMGGMDESQLKDMGPAKMRQIVEILDPHFRERMQVTTRTIFDEMGPLMSAMEPDVRDGMAEAFANRYNADELDAINRFLATPTGAKFGSGFMALATDPAYLKKMQQMTPRILDAMPAIMKKVAAAEKSLPKARKWDELSPEEKNRLSAILGQEPHDETEAAQ